MNAIEMFDFESYKRPKIDDIFQLLHQTFSIIFVHR